ncbi:polyisoprenoid-binding protein [Paracoccus suum]|uniref:Polyisoprenoid-binding protein n=2 Tax=Paracoccus suum TaxID=2259340 RepID=A0A344PNX7_9RHOB|nr:polyisoprenoid-binding protein [Paracoccus suum]
MAQDAAAPAAAPEAAPAAAPADTAAAPAASTDAATAPDAAAGGAYTFDPDHSLIVFSYDHMGYSTSTGMVRGVTGTINIDTATPANSTVEASFPLSAFVTPAKSLDEHLMGDQFFKGATPDTAVTFKSTKVEPDGDNEAKVTGDLTLNGVTKPVTLDVDLKKMAPSLVTNKPAVGFEAETKLKRTDFNLGAFAPAVGDEVEIRIVVEASKG